MSSWGAWLTGSDLQPKPDAENAAAAAAPPAAARVVGSRAAAAPTGFMARAAAAASAAKEQAAATMNAAAQAMAENPGQEFAEVWGRLQQRRAADQLDVAAIGQHLEQMERYLLGEQAADDAKAERWEEEAAELAGAGLSAPEGSAARAAGERAAAELKHGRAQPGAGACLEQVLEQNILGQLCEWGAEDRPEGTIVLAIRHLDSLLGAITHGHFWGAQTTQKPIAALVRACRDTQSPLRQSIKRNGGTKDLVHLLSVVVRRLLKSEDELLPFFYDDNVSDRQAADRFVLCDVLVQVRTTLLVLVVVVLLLVLVVVVLLLLLVLVLVLLVLVLVLVLLLLVLLAVLLLLLLLLLLPSTAPTDVVSPAGVGRAAQARGARAQGAAGALQAARRRGAAARGALQAAGAGGLLARGGDVVPRPQPRGC